MQDSLRNLLVKGTIIKTSYGSRPYLINEVSEPCNCGRLSDQLGLTNTGMQDWSPDHYHITCKDLDKSRSNGDPCYLNAYNLIDGEIRSIYCNDKIEILGVKKGTQFSLF
ncbi:hypothetical protein MM236_19070 [Belliella sp. DSM 107340]|uniref:Uncharacterized protein n=1 Tax=Belliella calami TaxID=2923436 RepID=A0ABS9UV64_9BACT|nr:hypothetical protein [Belliella calami]MCH7400105.1 hypothetical protein [Belliella calami]